MILDDSLLLTLPLWSCGIPVEMVADGLFYVFTAAMVIFSLIDFLFYKRKWV